MDEADAADATVEQHIRDALTRRRPTLTAIGQCYSCSAPVDAGRVLCDEECREDYERAERARRANGRSK